MQPRVKWKTLEVINREDGISGVWDEFIFWIQPFLLKRVAILDIEKSHLPTYNAWFATCFYYLRRLPMNRIAKILTDKWTPLI